MRAIIERATLLKVLGHVQSVVERRNTIPILSNVLIEAGEGALRLMATDLDLQVVESVQASVETPGVGTLPLFNLTAKLEKTPGVIDAPPPRLGAHTAEILGRIGYSTDDVARLKAEGAV